MTVKKKCGAQLLCIWMDFIGAHTDRQICFVKEKVSPPSETG